MNAFAPRALLNRKRIWVELTPSELYRLIRVLEADAMSAIENDRCSVCEVAADALLQRVAELREASR
jgi:hypothetical protein